MEREGGDRFLESEQVARGGMGCVDAARDVVIGRRVAIKTLRPELREDDRALQQFVAEARVTGQLEHPNVVPIYDLGDESSEDPYIVMRLVQGQSLTQLLQQPKPATSTQAADLLQRFVNILLRLCDALSFAHGRGIFHCDVKPDNIMVGEHGEVYLMDWGVAHSSPTQEGSGGTAAYMAPEQIFGRSEQINARTDVFGLGGVLYEILTGNAPNEGKGFLAAALGRTSRSFEPGALWNQVPPELCRIATKALSPEQAERYTSVNELRLELEQFLKGGGWFETLTVADGEPIVKEGEPGNTAYVIQSGQCDVWKTIQGQARVVRRLGPGDVFGEAAVFAPGVRTASIVAVGEVTLKVVTGDALNRELDQNPMLAAFVRSLANLFREADAALSVRPPPVR